MAAAVALRTLLVVSGSGDERFGFADSGSYLIVARTLPQGLWDPGEAARSASLARPPGYPTLVWLAAGGRSVALVALLGVVVAGATVWLTHRLAAGWLGPRASAVAAWVVAVDPASVGHSLLVGSEVLVAPLLLLAVLLVRRTLEDLRSGAGARLVAAATGVAVAACALTRPNNGNKRGNEKPGFNTRVQC